LVDPTLVSVSPCLLALVTPFAAVLQYLQLSTAVRHCPMLSVTIHCRFVTIHHWPPSQFLPVTTRFGSPLWPTKFRRSRSLKQSHALPRTMSVFIDALRVKLTCHLPLMEELHRLGCVHRPLTWNHNLTAIPNDVVGWTNEIFTRDYGGENHSRVITSSKRCIVNRRSNENDVKLRVSSSVRSYCWFRGHWPGSNGGWRDVLGQCNCDYDWKPQRLQYCLPQRILTTEKIKRQYRGSNPNLIPCRIIGIVRIMSINTLIYF